MELVEPIDLEVFTEAELGDAVNLTRHDHRA